MNRWPLLVFLLVVVAIGVSVILLVTGGGGSPEGPDARGDITITGRGAQPRELALADIRDASATRSGDELVLDVTMDAEIPKELDPETTTWRWELYENGQMTWLVSASLDLGTHVSVIATQSQYQASTVDDSLPGTIEVDGSQLIVTLQADEIRRFPTGFDWLLKTTLDGDRGKPTSALAEDKAPESGYLKVDE